ncbi:DoxX family membrane protein [Mycolicibacterium moriokaense]|nr:DoxX family membrane protein [Mycolicibacterium moriokaense]
MYIHLIAAAVCVVLAGVMLKAGVPKVLLSGPIPAYLQTHMGLSTAMVRFIGLCEVCGALGLIVGIFWRPIGIAAAIGLAALLIGAVGFHAKAGDYANAQTRRGATPPVVLTVGSIAAALLLVAA